MPITTTHDRHSRTGSEFFYLPLGANGGWSKETSRGSISLNNRRRLAVSNFNPQLNVIEFLHSVQILISPIEQLTALGQVRDLSRLKLFLLDRTAVGGKNLVACGIVENLSKFNFYQCRKSILNLRSAPCLNFQRR